MSLERSIARPDKTARIARSAVARSTTSLWGHGPVPVTSLFGGVAVGHVRDSLGLDPDAVRRSSDLLDRIRQFLKARGYLEVHTPLLARVADPHGNQPFRVAGTRSAPGEVLFLQTSPEMALKRLVAAGAGPLFEVAHAFRDEPPDSTHNPEFTLLEWYRPDTDYWSRLAELQELTTTIAGAPPFAVVDLTTGDGLQRLLQLASDGRSRRRITEQCKSLRDRWDDISEEEVTTLVSLVGGTEYPVALANFPPHLACQAEVVQSPGGLAYAARFEVYWKGVELANGYQELTDVNEMRRRLTAELRASGLPVSASAALERTFLAALVHGFPRCAGVAVGLDRLMMLAWKRRTLAEVMPLAFSKV